MKYQLEIELELPEQVDREMFNDRIMKAMDEIEDGLSESLKDLDVDQFSDTAKVHIEYLIIEQRKLIYG